MLYRNIRTRLMFNSDSEISGTEIELVEESAEQLAEASAEEAAEEKTARKPRKAATKGK